tara:strand:- start:169 stop:423 length:255 start_codon:yes stop_codon:yes gene_type:complete
MIKLKDILIEKKLRMPPGFKQAMKLFHSKSFGSFAKDEYNIDTNDIVWGQEKNKDGMNSMMRSFKSKLIFYEFVKYLLKKNIIK